MREDGVGALKLLQIGANLPSLIFATIKETRPPKVRHAAASRTL